MESAAQERQEVYAVEPQTVRSRVTAKERERADGRSNGREYTDDRIRTRGVPHIRACRCPQCAERRRKIDAKAAKARPLPDPTAPGYTEPLRRFIQRNSYDTDRDQGKYTGYAYILLDAIGAADMPGWMLGPQCKALVTAVYKLRNNHTEDYLILERYYVRKESEVAIARALSLSRPRIREALRFCVGYLHGCLDTDGEHARYRGITPDMLYEGYVDAELDRLFNADERVNDETIVDNLDQCGQDDLTPVAD